MIAEKREVFFFFLYVSHFERLHSAQHSGGSLGVSCHNQPIPVNAIITL